MSTFPIRVVPLLGLAALAACLPAAADTASTTGGFKIKTDDGAFEASFGGRIHFDYVLLQPDDGAGFGSDQVENNSGTYFRRVFVQSDGKLYDWSYRVQYNIAGGSNSFQDVWVSHELFGAGSRLYVGQKKPWRSLEEQGSNNNVLFMERPVTSASGIYGGRDYQQGLFYAYSTPQWFGGLSAYSLTRDSQPASQGSGANARLAWSPINSTGRVLHIGASYSSDHADNTALTPALGASYRYGGYRLGAGTVTETFASYGAGPSPSVDTVGLEFAAIAGPAYVNAEYASAAFSQDGRVDIDVDAGYVQASYFVTGESKTYSATDHTIGNPKPARRTGAVELKLRYEFMRGDDSGAGCSTTRAPASGIDACEYRGWLAGVNLYLNPAMRLMLDYQQGEADLGSAGRDRPTTVAARLQLSY